MKKCMKEAWQGERKRDLLKPPRLFGNWERGILAVVASVSLRRLSPYWCIIIHGTEPNVVGNFDLR